MVEASEASSLRDVHAEGRSGRAREGEREVSSLIFIHVTAVLYDRGGTWAGL